MNRGVAAVHSIVAWTLSSLLAVALTPLGVMGLPFARDRFRHALGWVRFYCRMVLVFCRISVRLEGREHVEQAFASDRALLVCNHQSLLDVPVLIATLPGPFAFVAKAELFELPLLGFVMRLCGFVPVGRGRSRETRSALAGAGTHLERGLPVLVFPEGTRSLDGHLGNFRRGAALMAIAHGTRVFPLAVDGTFAILPKGRVIGVSGPVTLRAGPPIDPGSTDPADRAATTGLTDRIARAVRQLLEDGSP